MLWAQMRYRCAMRDRRTSPGVYLFAAVVMISLAMGALFSLAVFMLPISDATGWTRSGLSSVALVNWIALGLGALLGGILSDRIGIRVVCTTAAFMIGLGMVVASQATTLFQLFLSFGVFVGFGAGRVMHR